MKKDISDIIPGMVRVEMAGVSDSPTPDLDCLPLLTAMNLVLMPGVSVPLRLRRESALKLAQKAEADGIVLGLVCQRHSEEETPNLRGLYRAGVLVRVLKVLEMPDGSSTALLYAGDRFRIKRRVKAPHDAVPDVIYVSAETEEDIDSPTDSRRMAEVIRQINEKAEAVIKKSPEYPDQLSEMLKDKSVTPHDLVNSIATHFNFDIAAKQAMLEEPRIEHRAMMLLSHLTKAEEEADLARDIMQKTRMSLDEQQRHAFLQQQIDTIREELYGDSDSRISDLRLKAEEKGMPPHAAAAFKKEAARLEHTNPQNPEYNVGLNYLETLVELPWTPSGALPGSIDDARNILDTDHYGLEKVKERVLEQIAVMMNGPEVKSPIICLVGPPGVGKTSLGQSIARALGRGYQRVALGGVHDESEIRGHRRTYIGAMPGRIIAAMKRAESTDPVLLLDEIDKLSNDHHGDPAAALLEVLDPEQNMRFHDNYIDLDYDLSRVLFIATANTLDSVPRPLLDRMEVIELSGYITAEKVEIGRRHIMPKILRDYCVDPESLSIPDDVMAEVVERYTGESGVRQLEKQLRTLVRKRVLHQRMSGGALPVEVSHEEMRRMLGVDTHDRDRYEGNEYAGVVTGLAWTQAGGEILFIESSLSAGKGEPRLTLTGNLGDVMKESAMIALQYVKSHAEELGVDPVLFNRYSLHIHVPEGAIPKDGPSAGITMAMSILSAFKQRRVRERIAMTGEITLRGRVLPVGGIKEKILAAKRAGITDIILSEDNRKNVEDISQIYLEGLTMHYVRTVTDVAQLAITDQQPANPINL